MTTKKEELHSLDYQELDVIFFLEDEEYGYGYTYLSEDEERESHRSYMYQDRFTKEEMLSESFDELLSESKSYVGSHETIQEALEEVIGFWSLLDGKCGILEEKTIEEAIEYGKRNKLDFVIY